MKRTTWTTRILVIVAIGLLSLGAIASGRTDQTNVTYPTPVGGMVAIAQAVVYPDSAKAHGIEGKVFVEVVIDAKGKMVSAEVKRGVNGELDQAALRAVSAVSWVPGKVAGQAEQMVVMVPIAFTLKRETDKK